MRYRPLLAVWVIGTLGGACEDSPGTPAIPYPDVQVTGQVLDVRGTPVAGARVTVANEYDTATAVSGSDGSFALVVDGAEAASTLTIADAHYRPFTTSAAVRGASVALGALGIMSNQEILVSVYGEGADIWMVRADQAGDPIQLTATADKAEITPCRSESGLVVRWANTTDGVVEEAAWDGSGRRVVATIDDGLSLMGIGWGDRGTFLHRMNGTSGQEDIVIAEDPPGQSFGYQWTGGYPDESPPVFGSFGPTPIHGNMLAFAGTFADCSDTSGSCAGIFTAFPYVTSSFFVPEHIGGTSSGDLYPRWSPYRADGSLDLAFVRDGDVYLSHVTENGEENVYSQPVRIYGGGDDDVRVNRFAWAPTTEGQPDRLVLAVNVFSSGSSIATAGDLVVLQYDHATGAVVGAPQVVYQGSAATSHGLAVTVDWR